MSCERCAAPEVERLVHLKEMDAYHDLFYNEYLHALEEYGRIESCLREVAWYNFETVCSTWREPWPETIPQSTVILHSARYELIRKRGRVSERGRFPVYYHGPVASAPTVPPEIMLIELKLAYDAVQRAREQVTAPYDWAPSGDKYDEMLRLSDGVQAYELRRLSKRNLCGHGGSARSAISRRAQLRLGDRLERQASEKA